MANRVNEAILSSQGARREARIRNLVRLRAWSEQKAREAKKDLPATLDLVLDPTKDVQDGHVHEDSLMQGNGDAEAMVT